MRILASYAFQPCLDYLTLPDLLRLSTANHFLKKKVEKYCAIRGTDKRKELYSLPMGKEDKPRISDFCSMTFGDSHIVTFDLPSLSLKKKQLMAVLNQQVIEDYRVSIACSKMVFVGSSSFLVTGFKTQQFGMASVGFLYPRKCLLRVSSTPLDEERHSHGVAKIGSYVYLAGGYTQEQYLDSVSRYDYLQEKCSSGGLPKLNEARANLTLVSIKNRYLYAFGGYRDDLRSKIEAMKEMRIRIEFLDTASLSQDRWKLLEVATDNLNLDTIHFFSVLPYQNRRRKAEGQYQDFIIFGGVRNLNSKRIDCAIKIDMLAKKAEFPKEKMAVKDLFMQAQAFDLSYDDWRRLTAKYLNKQSLDEDSNVMPAFEGLEYKESYKCLFGIYTIMIVDTVLCERPPAPVAFDVDFEGNEIKQEVAKEADDLLIVWQAESQALNLKRVSLQ